jgi:hypothetical protein
VRACCLSKSGGAHFMSAAADKRSCCSDKCFTKCISCDHPEHKASEESCFICATSVESLCLCCFEGGGSAKVSCCPAPFSLCALDDQCCCLFGKMSFPPNEAVPLEFGCCGVYCLKNVEAIEEYEKKVAEAENDGVVEAVIVSKGGAPATVVADTMQRDIAKRN